MNQQSIAFFDFDGTITSNDSFLQFLLFNYGRKRFLYRIILLIPVFVLYKLRLISDMASKEIIFSFFFKHKNFNEISDEAIRFSLKKIPSFVKKEAMDCIQWHKIQGHQVVIVSAGFSFILKPWCDANQIHLIATEIGVLDGIVTGKFSSANCWGSEKVKRIKEQFILSSFSTIFAYGDSKGDKEMLAIAHHANYQTFHS